MKEEFLTMSNQEIERLGVIERVCREELTQVNAAKTLGITTRQIRRLLKGYQQIGPLALVSKSRGKPSNRQYSGILKQQVLEHIRSQYNDFGPTLAAEKLAERQNIHIGIETARKWMTEAEYGKLKFLKE